MQKIGLTCALTFALLCGGCEFPGIYKLEIEQGNIVTQKMVNQLQPGMTRSQVRYIMGTPMLVDTFHQNRWDYVHTLQRDGHHRTEKRLTLYFKDDKLAYFTGDFLPAGAKKPAPATGTN